VTAGEGTALFDARLTPLDSQANQNNATGGNATGDGGRVRVSFPAGALAGDADVRVTSVSPQGLANLLPYGWSPVPGAVVDVRAASGASGALQAAAHLTITQTQGLASSTPLVLVRYDETRHGWQVVGAGLSAGANGALEADLPGMGQYAFVVADTGATAPPAPVAGQPLTSSQPADSASLDAANASASSSPRTASYSASARSTINFVANSATQLPSGVAIEATFNDTYKLLGGKDALLVDRPAQDFVLYAYPSAPSGEQPNRLAAFFVAKPTRTEFSITELLNANVHVEIRSGRQTKIGVLIDAQGGELRASNGAQLIIPANSLQGAQPVFFNDVQAELSGVQLPEGFEVVGVYDVDLTGATLNRAGALSIPTLAGDVSRIVVARLLTVGGQRAPKLVARAVESQGRLVSRVSAPGVPAGVSLSGITSSGRYVFIRIPHAFGYLSGIVTDAASNGGPAALTRVAADRTPFVDVTGTDGRYLLPGMAGDGLTGANQIGASALNTDATGRASAALDAQDAVAQTNITIAAAPLGVESVTPASGAQNMIATTPVTVSFNKPVAANSLTGSSFKVATASGNPVIGTITVLAGSRVAVFTPSSTLAGSTTYQVTLTNSVRDIYGKPLASGFSSNFTTAALVRVDDRLKPERIRINYPNAEGMSKISIPAGAVPEGSSVIAINNASGSTVSATSGTNGLELSIQAQVGDEITLIIRQPDGTEYRVSQGAYRRDDGFTSVGSSGGTLTSDDGQVVLAVPPGAIVGQADIKMTPIQESAIAAPRDFEMNPTDVPFGAGVQINAQGDFKCLKELHLEVAVPAGVSVTEGQRVALMKPSKMNFNGQQVDVWESVTSGKVEGGRFKSMSPPFLGFFLLALEIIQVCYFVPRRFRAVHGVVTEQVTGEASKPLAGVTVTVMRDPANDNPAHPPRVTATSGPNGGYGIFDYPYVTPVVLTAVDELNRKKVAIASPHFNIDPYLNPGLDGLQSMYAAIEFPPASASGPESRPALIDIQGFRGDLAEGQSDSLHNLGVVPVGSPVRIVAATVPKVAQFTGRLLVGGVEVQQLVWESMPPPAGSSADFRKADFIVNSEGNYSIEVETHTIANVAATRAKRTYNFVSLRNPNTRPPLPGSPRVLTISPPDKATQVDASSKIHIEFSEPVKNLVSEQTIYLVDEANAATRLGGRISSGGIPVEADTAGISSIDFEPFGLAGGKRYQVHVTTGVKDTDGHALDQQQTSADDNDPQPFESSFETFAGFVLTETPTADAGFRIAAAGQYAASITMQGANSSQMTVYDMSNPREPSVQYKGFIPQRAIAIAMVEVEAEDAFRVGNPKAEYTRLAFVTTNAVPDIERPTNLWIFNLEDPAKPEIVGVVSMAFLNRISAVPACLTIHKKRAYVGNMSQGGVFVIDLERALNDWARAKPQSGTFGLGHPQVRAVSPNKGFDFEAKVQAVTYTASSRDLSSPVMNISVIEQNLMPVAYVASPSKPQLISFGLPSSADGLNGFAGNEDNTRDQRVLAMKDLNPAGGVTDVRAVSKVNVKGKNTDLAVMLGAVRLWIWDVTDPRNPTQFPSRTFAEMGAPDAGYAKRMEIEGTLAYVMFTDKVVVFDFSDPAKPARVATIDNIGANLYSLSVKDGFIYSLSSVTGGGPREGLNVSIARPASQLIAYGVNANSEQICTNPVVISRGSSPKMLQPVGIFFQVFGHDLPQQLKVLIRKEKTVNGTKTEETLATLPAVIDTELSSDKIVVGKTQWNSQIVLDRTASYTAELILDEGGSAEFHSKREPVAFSTLITEYQTGFGTTSGRGFYSYILGGNANVTLTVNGQNRLADAADPHVRAYGLNVDEVKHDLPEGSYQFVLRASLEGNPSVTDEVEGEMSVADAPKDVRLPGSTMVNDVELSNGNLGLSYTDVSIKNRGLSLTLTRSYNTASANTFSPFGYGWRHNFQVLLVHDKNGKAYTMSGGDGSGQKFLEAKESGGKIPAEDPFQGTLVKNADGSFDYFTKSYVKYHFPGAMEEDAFNFFNVGYMGNLAYIEEPNGNRLTMQFDAQGRMTRVTDSANRALDFTYEVADTPFVGVIAPTTGNGISCTNKKQFGIIRGRFARADIGKAWRITTVKGPGGLEIGYEYDADGNLEKVTRLGVDTVSQATDDHVWKYAYAPTATVQTSTQLTHILKSVTGPNDTPSSRRVTTYDYHFDKFRLPVKSISLQEGISNTFEYTHNAANRVTHAVVTDGRSNRTSYEFDAFGHATSIAAPRGARTVLTWNNKGQKESELDPEGMLTTYRYENGNPVSQVMEGGGERVEITTRFNAKFSKPESIKDANGNVTDLTLDERGNVRSVTLPTGRVVLMDYYANGDLKSVLDEHNRTTTFEYDNYGNQAVITRQTDGDARVVTRQTFDARSRLKEFTDTLKPSVTLSYDALDRLVETITDDPTGFRDSFTNTYTYFPAGQLKTQVQTGTNQRINTTFAYDNLDRLTRQTENASGAGQFVLNYSYDANSNLLTENDRRGVTRTHAYDALNFRTSTTVSGGFGPSHNVETLTPDLVGNPTSVVNLYGQTTGFVYNGLHRLTKRTLPGNYTEEVTYDANGNVVTSRDRNARETTTTYDALNRPLSQKDPAGRITAWVYDDAASVVTMQQTPQGLTTTLKTDALGRPLRRELKFGAQAYATSYTYNGRTVEMRDPRGTVSTQMLSAFGQPADINVEGASPAWSSELRYASFGGVKSRKDANGRLTSYTVDSYNRPTAVSYAGGFTEQFAYDGEGNTLSHTNRRGIVSEMTYDNLGRQLTEKVRDNQALIPTMTVAYDDANLKESYTDALNHTTVVAYDGLHRRRSVTNPDNKVRQFEYDGVNLLKESDYKRQFTSYKYDGVNRLTEILDRNGKVTTFNHVDGDGTTVNTTDRRGHPRVEVFDPLGRLTRVTTGGQLLYSYEYDGNNNLTAKRDGRNNRTVYEYDPLNRLKIARHASTQTETYDYDAAGNVLSYSDGFGAPVAQTFDALNHPATRTDGAGKVTRFKFDGEGLLLEKTDPKGAQYKTTYQYNALGSLTSVRDANQATWALDYYDDQTLRSMTDALGHSVTYTYDPVKRLKTTTQHGNTQSSFPVNLVTTYDYDENGNRTSVLDPKGQLTSIAYDALDRARTVDYANTSGAGPRREQYEYDPEGNLTSIVEQFVGASSTLPSTRSYARTYDARNRLETATDPFGRKVAYEYDEANNLKRLTDAARRETIYNYDDLNRLQQVTISGGQQVSYSWKPDGHLEKVTYGTGMERSYAYDAADRLSSVTNTLGVNNLSQTQTEVFGYTYDDNSNRQTETRKFNGQTYRAVNYEYDLVDRLSKVDSSTPTAITAASGLKADFFDNADLTNFKLTRNDPNVDFAWPGTDAPATGVDGESFSARWTGQVEPLHSETYTFSAQTDEGVRLWIDGQLIIDNWNNQTPAESTGTIALEAGRKYDIKLEIADQTGDAGAKLLWSSATQTKEVIPQSRLTTPPVANASGSSARYTYDAVGNRKTEIGTDFGGAPINHSYEYDDLNRLTNANGYAGGDLTYEYDNNGNLQAARQGPTTTARYEYDARNQLRHVTGGAGQEVARYDYDVARRRIGRSIGGGSEQRYVYSGDRLINEYGGDGRLTNSHDYGSDLVRSELQGEGARWHFGDGQGSVTSLSSVEQGASSLVARVAARYEYNPWGEIVSGGATSVNQFAYTGQRLDGETGLMPLGNGERYYSPGLGRFIQQDSWTGLATMAQSMNRYTYVHNNPLRFTDPTGHSVLDDIWEGAKALGRGAKNVVLEPFRQVADVATVTYGYFAGIDSEHIQLSSGLGRYQQSLINSGVSPSDAVLKGLHEITFSYATVGTGPLIRGQIELAIAYNSGDISLREYNLASLENLGGGLAMLAVPRVTNRANALFERLRVGRGTGEVAPVAELSLLTEGDAVVEPVSAQRQLTGGKARFYADADGQMLDSQGHGRLNSVERQGSPIELPASKLGGSISEQYIGPERQLGPAPAGRPNPIGQQGPFRLTSEGEFVSTQLVRYDRAAHYGGAQTDGPVGNALRLANEGVPCPSCGELQISGTRTQPVPEHSPSLLEHYYDEGGYAMTDAQRRAYASSEQAFDGTLCLTCQRRQGAALSRESRRRVRLYGLGQEE
jgi:RHS repeat-associated protein